MNRQLEAEVSSGRASLFLGAGIGRHLGLPVGSELADELLRRSHLSYPELGSSLDLVAQEIYAEPGLGQGWVIEQLNDILNQRETMRLAAKSKPLQTIAGRRWAGLFTTNFDRTVEVAYDSNHSRAQDLLPLYEADPQVRRSDAGTLRYFKLNGSIDEARRNSRHQLVLTFAEQEETRSTRKVFYDVFQDLAINGPVIFLGFSFTHPGAYAQPSSPEVQELRGLLRTMGPAARTHYAVFPHDPERPETAALLRQLRAVKIEPICATFEEFSAQLERLSGEGPATARRPQVTTILRIGNAEIEFGERRQQVLNRYFELVHEDLAARVPKVSTDESLNGKANWRSFFSGQFVPREAMSRLTQVLEEPLDAAELLVVSAPLGWGKTFLCKAVASRLSRAGNPVLWLNPVSTVTLSRAGGTTYTAGTWDFAAITKFLREIREKSSHADQNERTAIVFVDDCPDRTGEAVGLVKYLRHRGIPARIVLSLRDADEEFAASESRELERAAKFNADRWDSENDEIDDLIEFCVDENVGRIETGDLVTIRNAIADDEADASFLLAMVIVFDREHRPFSEVINSLWRTLKSDEQRDILLRVALFHRIANYCLPRLATIISTYPGNERAQHLDSYYELIDGGQLQELYLEGEPVAGTYHSLVAERLVKVALEDDYTPSLVSDITHAIVANMTTHPYDVELLKRIAKRINDYRVSLGDLDAHIRYFEAAAEASANDPVICQQYAKFLLAREEFESALQWIERAIQADPDYVPLTHTKGNIYRRWAVHLDEVGHRNEATDRYEAARLCFEDSRMRRDADEYGYVTHLEMLRTILSNRGGTERDDALAEGVSLYREGLSAVPPDKFNMLLERNRFSAFDPSGRQRDELLQRLRSRDPSELSTEARIFVARELADNETIGSALAMLDDGNLPTTGRLLVVAAELLAKAGRLQDASLKLDLARRTEDAGSRPETRWKIDYWTLITSFLRRDYSGARQAAISLADATRVPRDRSIRGYVWRTDARDVPASDRILSDHGLLVTARVREQRGSEWGRLALTNITGDEFWLRFNPRFFSRSEFRLGEYLTVAIAILASGLRAEDPQRPPVRARIDDMYVEPWT